MKICGSCYWREGDRCYEGEEEGKFTRDERGVSSRKTIGTCEKYKNYRALLRAIFNGDKK